MKTLKSPCHAGRSSFGLASGIGIWILILFTGRCCPAQPDPRGHSYFVDCRQSSAGDGEEAHPWNSLAAAQAHPFSPGDQIALARGTVCRGSLSPQGSGSPQNPIRLTAYGVGPRPRIVASKDDRQALVLFNQEYWLIDSLDLSGSNTYGVFISGDKGVLHHLYLKNLYVHNVMGGAMKNKDNGLVVVGPGSLHVTFADILVDGVIAEHTNQWAGILIGGGPFPYAPDAPLNQHVTVRNSSVEDVYGDGIVLFRDSDGLIETSSASLTGMQPTESIGTPNAIWTWTCTRCIVRDNEAFLTDSPGVDGGAYDIDWDDTENLVERNYAHDTQGYCIAVFAAGFVTSHSTIRDNLCVNNAMSPRLAALQGAVYLHSWNGGVIRGLEIEHNRILFSPPVRTAAAIVSDADFENTPPVLSRTLIESSAAEFYRFGSRVAASDNTYRLDGLEDAKFTLGDRHQVSLADLQQAGIEKGSILESGPVPVERQRRLRIEASVPIDLDRDGLLGPQSRAQLMVLRSLARQYGTDTLSIIVHLGELPDSDKARVSNALEDLDAVPIHFEPDGQPDAGIRLMSADGQPLAEWHGFQNAATIGGRVRELLGAPRFQDTSSSRTEKKR